MAWQYIIQLQDQAELTKAINLLSSIGASVQYTAIPQGEFTRSIIVTEHQKGMIDSQGDISYKVKTRFGTEE
jgi:hypothetical protein